MTATGIEPSNSIVPREGKNLICQRKLDETAMDRAVLETSCRERTRLFKEATSNKSELENAEAI